MGFPGSSVGKESTCNKGNQLQCWRPKFNPWVGKISWRRKWQPTPVFLLGNPMDRGAWQATFSGVTRVRYDLKTKPPPPLPRNGMRKWSQLKKKKKANEQKTQRNLERKCLSLRDRVLRRRTSSISYYRVQLECVKVRKHQTVSVDLNG